MQTTNLAGAGYWNDTSGAAGQMVTVNGNRAVRVTSSGIAFLNLGNLPVQENQTRTLFFRIIARTTTTAGVTNIVGLTDKSQRAYADEFSNIGPVLYAAPFTNAAVGIDTNAWYLGTRNSPGGAIDYVYAGSNPPLSPASFATCGWTSPMPRWLLG